MEAHKFADIFPMIEGNELEVLKNDIKEHGLLNPIVLYENKILDGRNRFKACKEIGIEPKFEEYKGDKPLEFVISLNLKRRHLTKDQLSAISPSIIKYEIEEAQRRQKQPFDNYKFSTGNEGVSVKSREGRVDVRVAKQLGVGESKISQIKKLMENSPELVEEVRLGHKTLSDIKKEQRLEKIQKQREELQKEILEQPTGLYGVIVIDPPWRYDGDIFKEQKDQMPIYESNGMRGTTPYPTMSLEQIKNIKLPAKDDCVLWLWTTNNFLLKMQELLDEWGFELKSILTWNKEHFGTGRWLRSQTEHCILAIKGKPFFNNTKWSTLIREKRTEHSAKPEIFYKMVDEICAGRKLDYFARKKREGWDVYGDEIPQ
jgi:N6-adenosine-specific RNA methylase IME4